MPPRARLARQESTNLWVDKEAAFHVFPEWQTTSQGRKDAQFVPPAMVLGMQAPVAELVVLERTVLDVNLALQVTTATAATQLLHRVEHARPGTTTTTTVKGRVYPAYRVNLVMSLVPSIAKSAKKVRFQVKKIDPFPATIALLLAPLILEVQNAVIVLRARVWIH